MAGIPARDAAFTLHNTHMKELATLSQTLAGTAPFQTRSEDFKKNIEKLVKLRWSPPKNTHSPWDALGLSRQKGGSFADVRDFIRTTLHTYYSVLQRRQTTSAYQLDFIDAMECIEGNSPGKVKKTTACNKTAFRYIARYAYLNKLYPNDDLKRIQLYDIREIVHFIYSNTFLGPKGSNLPPSCIDYNALLEWMSGETLPLSAIYGPPILALKNVFEILFVDTYAGFTAESKDGIDPFIAHMRTYQNFKRKTLQLSRYVRMQRENQANVAEDDYNLQRQINTIIPALSWTSMLNPFNRKTFSEWWNSQDTIISKKVGMTGQEKISAWEQKFKQAQSEFYEKNSKMLQCRALWKQIQPHNTEEYFFSPAEQLDKETHNGTIVYKGLKRVNTNVFNNNITESYKQTMVALRAMKANFASQVGVEARTLRSQGVIGAEKKKEYFGKFQQYAMNELFKESWIGFFSRGTRIADLPDEANLADYPVNV